MVYRSNIYVKMKKGKAFELKAFLATWKFSDGSKVGNNAYIQTHDDDYIYLLLEGWEFYRDFPEVIALISFVRETHKRDGEPIGMIAIGEDGVTKEWGSPWEVDLEVETRILGFESN